MTLRVGSMFSGYGGLDLAVGSVLDAAPAWFVEFDDDPSRILAHHWPDVPNFGDVTQVDWSTVPPVDVLTGGYPCQPFSAAGRRKGTNDERHLWPYVRDAIRVLRPRFALLENVAGHRSLGFDTVSRRPGRGRGGCVVDERTSFRRRCAAPQGAAVHPRRSCQRRPLG